MTNYTKKKLSRSIANTKGGAFFGLKTAKEKAAAAEAAAAAAEAAAAEAAAAEAARIAQLTSEALKAKQRETQKKENRLKILKQFATETESETHKLNQTKKRNQRTQNYEKQRIRVAQQMEETRKAQNQLQKTQANKLQFRIAKAKAESLANDLGVKLGGIISFNEGENNPTPMYAKTMMADSAIAPVAAPAQLPKGEDTISSDVTITYEIK